MKLSVIIPVNKITDNLEPCIDSILNQTEKNIEVIISCYRNDFNILKEKYNNLKVISNDSSNMEVLKNSGIKYSKGEYISIINQNMILNSKMYEDMLFQRADICLCAYIRNNKKQKLELFSKLASIIKIDDNINNKLFKRNLVVNNLFSLDNVLANKLFIYKAVATANTFGFVHNISYSTNECQELYQLEKIYKTFDEIFKYYKIKNLYEKNKSKLEYVCAVELLGNTFRYLRKIGDKKLIEENWKYLNEKFPNWRKNLYIRRMPGLKSLNIKITNKFIYDLKSNIKW